MQVSPPSAICTEPSACRSPTVTVNWTVTWSPAREGSGVSAVMVVTVGAAASGICALVTAAKPVGREAERARARRAGDREIGESGPAVAVGALCWWCPPSEPPPGCDRDLHRHAALRRPGCRRASSSWITGCCPSTTPLTAFAEGWVRTDSRAGAPAVALGAELHHADPRHHGADGVVVVPGVPPSVQAAVACPAASVEDVAGVTLPPPMPMTHVTATAGTAIAGAVAAPRRRAAWAARC